MKDVFEIRINGQKFSLWESANYTRSLDDMYGGFNFVTSNKPKNYPVKRGDAIQILINGIAVLTGFVFTIESSGSINANMVSITGSDKTRDIADSSLPDNAKNSSGNVSLKSLCDKVIKGLGLDIKVIDRTGGISNFKSSESEYGDSVSNAFSYLDSFARKKTVFLITDGNGDLVLWKPENDRADDRIIHEFASNNNNVLTWRGVLSDNQRFNKYIVRSQDNASFDDDADYEEPGNDRKGQAVDSEIRAGRYLEIMAEQSMNNKECLNRAKEEANLRRAKSKMYECTVQGASQKTGKLWNIGQYVQVKDDVVPLRGLFIISKVSMTQDIAGGTITALTMSLPDAYTGVDTINKQTERKASIG